jgi:hypothetical protein
MEVSDQLQAPADLFPKKDTPNFQNTVTFMSDYSWFVTGFIDHLYTQLVTTSNYNSLTLKITVTAAYIKSSMSSLVVSWQPILTMSSVNVLIGWRILHNWLIAPSD